MKKLKDILTEVLLVESEMSKNNVLLVFGGINYATPEWMESQIPLEIIDNNTMLIKAYNTNIEEVIDELNELEYNSLQVVGFSAGGRNVFKIAKIKKPDFIGLIDPTVPKNWSLEGFPTNSTLFFNSNNWDSYPEIKERQLELKQEMLNSGMTVVEEELSHKIFPKEFFNIYIK